MYKYFALMLYTDTYVSNLWGCIICTWLWVSLNALLMLIFDVYGHIVIILIGIPVIVGVIYNLRKKRVKQLLLQSIENVKSSVEALTQIVLMQQIIKNKADVTLIGIVNLHVLFFRE
jgi:Ni,Fe-hydrogenase III large subunit